jgi:hypothetical protein
MAEELGKSVERLRILLNNRDSLVKAEIDSVIIVFQNMKKLFDDTISRLIQELGEEVDILEFVGDDVIKEHTALMQAELDFENINRKISEILNLADKGIINPVNQRDGAILVDALQVIDKINVIRSDLDRWARRETRTYDAMAELLAKA